MQYKTLEQLIEKYLDEPNNKELQEIFNNTSELFKDVYIQMKRPIKNDEERKKLEDEKEILKEILIKKGYIKNEKQRTAPQSKERKIKDKKPEKKKRIGTLKVKRLEKYKQLYFMVENLINEFRTLEEEKNYADSIQAVNYSKDKVKTSVNSYSFKTITYDIKLERLEQRINKNIELLKAEEEFLKNLIDNIEDLRTQNIFYARYILFDTWEEISKQLNIAINTCKNYHSEGLKKLDILN